jgi:hypothetical protein
MLLNIISILRLNLEASDSINIIKGNIERNTKKAIWALKAVI